MQAKPVSAFRIDTKSDHAFVCDSFSVQLSTRNLDAIDGTVVDESPQADVSTAGGFQAAEQLRRRQSVRALHAAFGRVTDVSQYATSVTTRVDFIVACHTVTQHVNMSLLRLVHQVCFYFLYCC